VKCQCIGAVGSAKSTDEIVCDKQPRLSSVEWSQEMNDDNQTQVLAEGESWKLIWIVRSTDPLDRWILMTEEEW